MTVSKITAADAATVLERLAGSDRVERGAVFIISVEAIRERSGERWSKKRDDVWGYLGRKLNEYLSYQDIHHRISETDVLVAMTTEDGVAAQAVGMKVLEEVLEFFLGSVEPMDIRIRSVSKIEGDELTVADLDPAVIATARETQAATPHRNQVSAEIERERNPISFVASNGQRLRVDFALENIVSLSHKVTAVLRVEPMVSFSATGEVIPTRRFARLSDADILAIDRATLAFGALFMPVDARTQPPLILPASFRTMGQRKGRHELITIAGVTPERVRQGMMLEFIDIDRGTPAGRMVEVVSLVGSLTRGVLARLQPARDALDPVQGARFNGLTLDLSDVTLPKAKLEAFMRLMAHQMRGKAPALIAQGLSDYAHMEMADNAGFTHAGVRSAPLTNLGREVA
ncbi:MAG: hypothetical protein KKE02_12550 [Alphaproteobacteria bacterium]|nr:hypothetical protein [Alphaproteobacteria bacterium]MBU1512645.1 hypothetical protein [Alphaproteobacteria bacterium]MBU2095039.1 hypothetical protein [Alphaproteobacteria bacterium]MBU2151842.1 hypothetical protein [Alphaproteobacteria bacterium]MBU2306241.1 hypothetical protein [Alphaproteobacteria bacterium]